MRILLVSLNAKYVHLAPAPYALAAGIAHYAAHPHTVQICNATVNEKEDALLAAITEGAWDVIGFCSYIWNISLVERLLPRVRAQAKGARLLLGGPEVSYRQADILDQHPAVDFVLSGEGEEPVARLLDALEEGTPLSLVSGLSFRTEDGYFIGAPHIAEGTPPSPLAAGYAEAAHGRIAYLEASRGCPFRCAFCLSGRAGGVRYFDMDEVKSSLLRLANAGVRTIKLVDRTFNADPARAREIFSFLIAQSPNLPEGLSFHFEMSGDLLDEQTLALLQAAPHGLFRMELGVQSLNPDTLRAIRRSPHTARLVQSIRRLISLGNITVHLDLIAGLPHEDYASLCRGLDEVYALSPHMLQLGFLKLLYGAPMREERSDYPCTHRAEPPYEVVSTPAISAEELDRIHTLERGLDRLYNSGRYRETLSLLLSDGRSPSALFLSVGKALATLPQGAPLKDEMALLYPLLVSLSGLDGEAVRDAMLLDCLATNSSRDIPPVLRRADATLSRIKAAYDRQCPPSLGVRRAIGILYTRGVVAVAEYHHRDPVSGRYPVRLLSYDKNAKELLQDP